MTSLDPTALLAAAETAAAGPAGSSAFLNVTALARMVGTTARELNAALAAHGYLVGPPGHYATSAKGAAFAVEQVHSQGGGYANVWWATRQWDPKVLAELAADITKATATPPPVAETASAVAAAASTVGRGGKVGIGVGVAAILVAGVAFSRPARRRAQDTVVLRATRAWRTITGASEPVPLPDSDGPEPDGQHLGE